jgi:UDP-N-acetylglucosamine acyltransferase
MPAQDTNTKTPLGKVEIGKNCEIREFVTISSPKIETGTTKIGDECYIMNFSHIAHDVILENNVVLINNVNIGGHVHIGNHSMLMANTAIHQFCHIGAYSALAPFSGMRQDLPPFCMFNGKPGRFAGLNTIGLRRSGLSVKERNEIKTITKLFFQDKLSLEEIEKIITKDKNLKTSKPVQQFLRFAQKSPRGISRKTIKEAKDLW